MRELISAVLLVALLVGSEAVALEPSTPNQIVALFGIPSEPCPGDFPGSILLNHRRLPSGFAEPFRIPEGHVLILTNFAWRGGGAPPAELAVATLAIAIGDSGINGVSSAGEMADSTGKAFASRNLEHGIVIAAGNLACIAPADFGGPLSLDIAEAQGFLTRAE